MALSTVTRIPYPGPPTSGTFDVNDIAVDTSGRTWYCTAAGSPGSWTEGAAGSPVVRHFPFAYNTAGLATGITLFTPNVGDVILSAWFDMPTVFNAAAKADFGTLTGGAGTGGF